MNGTHLAARAENSPPSRRAAGLKPGGSTPSAGLFPLFPLLAAGLVIGLLAACQSAPSPERKPVKVGNWTVETRATVLIDQAVVH